MGIAELAMCLLLSVCSTGCDGGLATELMVHCVRASMAVSPGSTLICLCKQLVISAQPVVFGIAGPPQEAQAARSTAGSVRRCAGAVD